MCDLILHVYSHTWVHTCKNTFTLPKPCDCVGKFWWFEYLISPKGHHSEVLATCWVSIPVTKRSTRLWKTTTCTTLGAFGAGASGTPHSFYLSDPWCQALRSQPPRRQQRESPIHASQLCSALAEGLGRCDISLFYCFSNMFLNFLMFLPHVVPSVPVDSRICNPETSWQGDHSCPASMIHAANSPVIQTISAHPPSLVQLKWWSL